MIWLLLLSLFLICSGMSLVFCIYLGLLWYATIHNAESPQPEDHKQPHGLSASELQRLPGAADGAVVAGSECAVCLDEIESGQPARVLPTCMHAFHLRCSDAWLSSHPHCPVCRASLIPAACFDSPSHSEARLESVIVAD